MFRIPIHEKLLLITTDGISIICCVLSARNEYIVITDIQIKTKTAKGEETFSYIDCGEIYIDRTKILGYKRLIEKLEIPEEEKERKIIVSNHSAEIAKIRRSQFKLIKTNNK